jgi:hypothetical protein
LRGYDPAKLAQSLEIPMIILQGERDIQVSMTDFDNWKMALGSRKNVVLKSYPAVGHMFIPVNGPATAEYDQPGHVESDVISDIAEWIKKL